MSDIITVSSLKKSFGKVKAVKGIDFSVKKGSLFAFLGPNGAGKSTTIDILCTLNKYDDGDVTIAGFDLDHDADNIRNSIGVVFQDNLMDKKLTVRENLMIRAGFYHKTKSKRKAAVDEAAKYSEIEEFIDRDYGTLSGGQRRRVDIARAIIHNPEFLILDEPTTGLDPNTRKKLWNIIKGLRERNGLTVFLTTHYMEEAADADFIIIIEKGKIITEGTPLDLKNKYAKDIISIYNIDEESIKRLNLPYTKIRDGYKLEIDNTSYATELIINNKDIFKDYEIIKGKMDDVFLNATGNNLEALNEEDN